MSKDGLVTLRWKDSKVVVLLINCLDPSKLTSVERRQKGTSEKLKVPCPGIIKEYNSDMNGVDMHDQLKTSNEIDRKSRFRYLHFSGISGIRYLRFFFSPMDSVVVNAHVIYKKKIALLFQNHPRWIVDKPILLSKTQNHCQETQALCWITTTLKKTRSHCPIYWKTSTLPVLLYYGEKGCKVLQLLWIL